MNQHRAYEIATACRAIDVPAYPRQSGGNIWVVRVQAGPLCYNFGDGGDDRSPWGWDASDEHEERHGDLQVGLGLHAPAFDLAWAIRLLVNP